MHGHSRQRHRWSQSALIFRIAPSVRSCRRLNVLHNILSTSHCLEELVTPCRNTNVNDGFIISPTLASCRTWPQIRKRYIYRPHSLLSRRKPGGVDAAGGVLSKVNQRKNKYCGWSQTSRDSPRSAVSATHASVYFFVFLIYAPSTHVSSFSSILHNVRT